MDSYQQKELKDLLTHIAIQLETVNDNLLTIIKLNGGKIEEEEDKK